ncbi:sigma factor-like helix-turn-helix DNA-binding protein [Puia sp. P3]
MEQSIEQLPQQCRIIFRLIKEEGIKYKEVAEILNISPAPSRPSCSGP